MSRRRQARERTVDPDPRYSSEEVAKFINCVMRHGKKTVARTIVYEAIDHMAQKLKEENKLSAFEQALKNAEPSVEVKSQRFGGATYQVPVEIRPKRRRALAIQAIIKAARNRSGKNMWLALGDELANCFNNEGDAIRAREQMHKMAEANKAFANNRRR